MSKSLIHSVLSYFLQTHDDTQGILKGGKSACAVAGGGSYQKMALYQILNAFLVEGERKEGTKNLMFHECWTSEQKYDCGIRIYF